SSAAATTRPRKPNNAKWKPRMKMKCIRSREMWLSPRKHEPRCETQISSPQSRRERRGKSKEGLNHRCTQIHTDKNALHLCESVCICGSLFFSALSATLR